MLPPPQIHVSQGGGKGGEEAVAEAYRRCSWALLLRFWNPSVGQLAKDFVVPAAKHAEDQLLDFRPQDMLCVCPNDLRIIKGTHQPMSGANHQANSMLHINKPFASLPVCLVTSPKQRMKKRKFYIFT